MGNNDQDFTSDPVWFSDLGRAGKNTAQLGITETLLDDGENHRTSRPRMDNGRAGEYKLGRKCLFQGFGALPSYFPALLLLWDCLPQVDLKHQMGSDHILYFH